MTRCRATSPRRPASTSAWPWTRARGGEHPTAAPAERDPPVGRGPEVVEKVAGVGYALAAGPADLVDQIGHRLGDDHVARGHGRDGGGAAQGLLSSSAARIACPARTVPPPARTSTSSPLTRRPVTRELDLDPGLDQLLAARAPGAQGSRSRSRKHAPPRNIGDAQRAWTSAASHLDRLGLAQLLAGLGGRATSRRGPGRSRSAGSRRAGTRRRLPVTRTIRRSRRRRAEPRAPPRSPRPRRTAAASRAGWNHIELTKPPLRPVGPWPQRSASRRITRASGSASRRSPPST